MPKVSTKNQITIPVDVLQETGINAGDDVVIIADGDGEIRIQARGSRIHRYAGAFDGVTRPGTVEELRREWDR